MESGDAHRHCCNDPFVAAMALAECAEDGASLPPFAPMVIQMLNTLEPTPDDMSVTEGRTLPNWYHSVTWDSHFNSMFPPRTAETDARLFKHIASLRRLKAHGPFEVPAQFTAQVDEVSLTINEGQRWDPHEWLRAMPRLRVVNVAWVFAPPSRLPAMPLAHTLYLSADGIPDFHIGNVLADLCLFHSLTNLSVFDIPLVTADIFLAVPTLRVLGLAKVAISTEGLNRLHEMPRLEELRLNGPLEDCDVSSLSASRSLTRLTFGGVVHGVAHVAQHLPTLTELRLRCYHRGSEALLTVAARSGVTVILAAWEDHVGSEPHSPLLHSRVTQLYVSQTFETKLFVNLVQLRLTVTKAFATNSLAHVTRLEDLELSGSSSLAALNGDAKGLTALRKLSCNDLSWCMDGLPNLPRLTEVSVSSNKQLTSLTPFSGCRALSTLNVSVRLGEGRNQRARLRTVASHAFADLLQQQTTKR